ncbi:MAG: preprotein translocase subunit SecD [candidate division NC10 bacterium]|nr:preprotein translocase subunit SecD [candidate division NC10 bacterium]
MRRKIGPRAIVLLVATLCTGYYLIPSLGLTAGLPSLLPGFLPRADQINPGLDLQGGMHLVLEVQVEKAVEAATDRLMADARRILENEHIAVANLRREGVATIVLEVSKPEDRAKADGALSGLATLDKVPGPTPAELRMTLQVGELRRIEDLAVRQSLETIRNRVDQFGVAEPYIVPEGARRIVVELPGIKDPQRAINLIGKTALLELKAVDTTYNPADAEHGKVKLPASLQMLLRREVDPGTHAVSEQPIIVQRQPILTGSSLTAAEVRPDNQGGWVVAFTLDRQGAQVFSDFTGANIGRQLAIVLDNTVYSAPVIRSQISEGRGQIEGNFAVETARDLAIVLRAGALPAPVKIISNLTVGPTLGQDSIHEGVRAAVVAAILVAVLLAVYYKLSGVIADFALLLNSIMLVGILVALRATLTLPGIAGIALGIGMAVDSNVLILERIREELRLGKTVRSAIDAGYDKAFVTIVDSHVTTLITAAALFLFGTGPIKGFAVTLSLGVTINLFTALMGTRVVYDWMTSRRELKALSI